MKDTPAKKRVCALSGTTECGMCAMDGECVGLNSDAYCPILPAVEV